jgi:hypothetical protein
MGVTAKVMGVNLGVVKPVVVLVKDAGGYPPDPNAFKLLRERELENFLRVAQNVAQFPGRKGKSTINYSASIGYDPNLGNVPVALLIRWRTL